METSKRTQRKLIKLIVSACMPAALAPSQRLVLLHLRCRQQVWARERDWSGRRDGRQQTACLRWCVPMCRQTLGGRDCACLSEAAASLGSGTL
ncbi:hypothetical protein F5148DRAFT_1161300 [Russula earlei]|uniref:Uncharacterized protein n=1 Tax=Russula earlei TaxID=71964 RepID=A0ACC0UNR7_9AGAM|nr:hypothetical protein F5148DRAFT_1161300 [Russula earlei]